MELIIKVGDLAVLQNLHEDWGKMALITALPPPEWGYGQIVLVPSGWTSTATIPWTRRHHYIKKVIKG